MKRRDPAQAHGQGRKAWVWPPRPGSELEELASSLHCLGSGFQGDGGVGMEGASTGSEEQGGALYGSLFTASTISSGIWSHFSFSFDKGVHYSVPELTAMATPARSCVGVVGEVRLLLAESSGPVPASRPGKAAPGHHLQHRDLLSAPAASCSKAHPCTHMLLNVPGSSVLLRHCGEGPHSLAFLEMFLEALEKIPLP